MVYENREQIVLILTLYKPCPKANGLGEDIFWTKKKVPLGAGFCLLKGYKIRMRGPRNNCQFISFYR
jgi:hypothetical protein